MQVRVKPDCQLNVITAFGGHEYTQREWRPVPVECEAEALRHPFLETGEEKAPDPIE